MSKVSLLFDVKAETLDEARPRSEAALDVRMELRASDFLGGAYDHVQTGHEELRLMTNFIDDDGTSSASSPNRLSSSTSSGPSARSTS